MRALRLLLCCAVVLGPAACIVPRVDYDQATAGLNASKSCCSDLLQAVAAPIKSGSAFGITEKSDVHDFGDEGKSYFRLVDVGNVPSGTALLLRSQMTASGGHQMFFYTAVELLDENFGLIRKIAPEQAEFNQKAFSGGPRSDLRFVLDGAAKPKYLVIYTTQKIIKEGKSVPLVERGPPRAPGAALIAEALGHEPQPAAAIGEIPYYGSPVSSESGLTLYVLSAVDQEVPI
jgi:hypothetical protein